MPVTNLERSSAPLDVVVKYDEVTAAAIEPFDLAADDHRGFYPWVEPDLPVNFGLGVIVGASGSGKSLLLRAMGGEREHTWSDDLSICAHFPDATTATDRLHAVGLNEIPVWRLPYRVLSNGQKFRADLARRIGDDALIDEYTSVVDRNVARAASAAVRRWSERSGVRRMVFSTCHRDVLPWLRPDWVIDTDVGTLTVGDAPEAPRWWEQHIRQDRGGLVGAIGLE